MLRDRIPAGLRIDTASITLDDGTGAETLSGVYTSADRMLSVYLGDIPYGRNYTLTFTATLTQSVEETDIGNIAWAKGKDSIPDAQPGDPYDPGADKWPDHNPVSSDKVYPNDGDKLVVAGPRVAKSVRNATRIGAADAWSGDVLEYEIEIANTQVGSNWRDVVVVDQLPEMLELAGKEVVLIKPNGEMENLAIADVYDAQARTITIELPGSVRTGGTYWLRYSAVVTDPVPGAALPARIVNEVTAVGKDYAGNRLRAQARQALPYRAPDPVGAEVTKSAKNRTRPDDAATAKPGDVLVYEVRIANTQENSEWQNVVAIDELPRTVELTANEIELVKPDGTTVLLAAADVYDAQTHTITVSLPGGVNAGETYLLRYAVTVAQPAADETIPAEIINVVTVNGNDLNGNAVRAGDHHVLTYDVTNESPVADGAKIAKSARNLTHPGTATAQSGDVVEYEIEIANTQENSVWQNIVVTDEMSGALELTASEIELVKPDGTAVLLAVADVYDAQTHTITVNLPEDLRAGDTCLLRYTATVIEAEDGVKIPAEIINAATATGNDFGGNVVRVGDHCVLTYDETGKSPVADGAKVTKSAQNLTHPGASKVQSGDVVEYEIEIANTQENSVWQNIVVTDDMPGALELTANEIELVRPDGTKEWLNVADVYDAKTHTIAIRLPKDLRAGESSLLRYTATVIQTGDGVRIPAEIINAVTATGSDLSGNVVRVGDHHVLRYEEADEPTIGVGAKVAKSARNMTHPGASKARSGDVIAYEIELANTRAGSTWQHIVATDEMPNALELTALQIELVRPDGTTELLAIADVYDAQTHRITIDLPDDLHANETCLMRYTATVIQAEDGVKIPARIINAVTATGDDLNGNAVRVGAHHVLRYNPPKEDEESEEEEAPRTGDDTNIMFYVVLMLISGCVLAEAVFASRKRRRSGKR